MYGCEAPQQWNLFSKPGFPEGTQKPWTRKDYVKQSFPVSTGFSLCTTFPSIDLSVLGIEHQLAKHICGGNETLTGKHMRYKSGILPLRRKVLQTLQKAKLKPAGTTLTMSDNYYAFPNSNQLALVTNHLYNVQTDRAKEYQELEKKVSLETSFNKIAIERQLAKRFFFDFSDRLRVYP